MDTAIHTTAENKLDSNTVSFAVDSDILSNLNKSTQPTVDVHF